MKGPGGSAMPRARGTEPATICRDRRNEPASPARRDGAADPGPFVRNYRSSVPRSKERAAVVREIRRVESGSSEAWDLKAFCTMTAGLKLPARKGYAWE